MIEVARRWEFNKRTVKLRNDLAGRIKENLATLYPAYIFITAVSGVLLVLSSYFELYLNHRVAITNLYLQWIYYFMFRNGGSDLNIAVVLISAVILFYVSYRLKRFNFRAIDEVYRKVTATLAREEYGRFILDEVIQVFESEKQQGTGTAHLQRSRLINTLEREILLCGEHLANVDDMRKAVKGIIDKDLQSRQPFLWFHQYQTRLPYISVIALGITVFLLLSCIFTPGIPVLLGYYLIWTHGVTETQARMLAICDLILANLDEDAAGSEPAAPVDQLAL